jgi:hypothetical protein
VSRVPDFVDIDWHYLETRAEIDYQNRSIGQEGRRAKRRGYRQVQEQKIE